MGLDRPRAARGQLHAGARGERGVALRLVPPQLDRGDAGRRHPDLGAQHLGALRARRADRPHPAGSSAGATRRSRMGAGTPTAWQHDARRSAPTRVTVFDNAGPPSPRAHSRGVVLRVDPAATRSRWWRRSRSRPRSSPQTQGDLQRLPNGNWWIGWGNVNECSEVTAGRTPAVRSAHARRLGELPHAALPVERDAGRRAADRGPPRAGRRDCASMRAGTARPRSRAGGWRPAPPAAAAAASARSRAAASRRRCARRPARRTSPSRRSTRTGACWAARGSSPRPERGSSERPGGGAPRDVRRHALSAGPPRPINRAAVLSARRARAPVRRCET